jgi:hypothetical protein
LAINRVRILLAIAVGAMMAVALGAFPATAKATANVSAAAAAGGCWDEGCNYQYYNYGGPNCTDVRRVSPTVYGDTGSVVGRQWWMEILYSPSCGAGFAYLHNMYPRPGLSCYLRLYRSRNSGASWDQIWAETVEPGLDFAYTVMLGDADWNERLAGQVACRQGSLTIYSDWARES